MPAEAAEAIREYVRMLRACSRGGLRPKGWHYDGPNHLIEAHGRLFESAPLPPDGMAVIRAAVRGHHLHMRACFANAARAVLSDRTGRLAYCEGYAFNVIPTLHAWAVLDGAIVVDLTWERGYPCTGRLRSKIIGTFGDEMAYFGVTFTTEQVREVVLRREAYGPMLFDFRDDSLLSAPFTSA